MSPALQAPIEALKRAWERRRSFVEQLQAQGTEVFRLFSGAREGIPGLTIDCWGKVAVFYLYEGRLRLDAEQIRGLGESSLESLRLKSIYVKHFTTDRSQEADRTALYSPIPLVGQRSLPELFVKEAGLSFLIKPYSGFSTGLFLDQRANRKFLADHFGGKRVLNCFAYTCGFSVYCAARGSEVVSVDLSRKYLTWGKENFLANSLALKPHRFVEADVFSYFCRAKKRGERFDLIILDPPSFSRSKEAGTFSVEKQLGQLLSGAADLLSPRGKIFFSSNLSSWTSQKIRALAAFTFRGRAPRYIELPTPPLDFAREENPLSTFLTELN